MQRNPVASLSRAALIAAAAAALLASCAWVKLTEHGERVHVATAAEVASCERLGATHARTSAKLGFIPRRKRKVAEELEYLARNEAAEMGGDTIVPRAEASREGRRSFDVYRCRSL